MESPSPSPTPTNTDGTSTDGRTTVSDSSVVSGLYINLILGVLLTLGFCITQTWSRELYRFRTFSESVTLPPPNISMKGRWAKYIRWAKVTWHVTDIDILVSCGLDAFVMHKLPMLGIQYFIPMAFLSMFVLVPLSLTNNWLQDEQNEVNSGRLAWLTISAIAPDSPLLWVHFSLLYVYVLYGLGLLYHHFVQFARLRLLYIRRGDDLSFYAEVLAQKMRQEQAKVAQLQAAANSVDKGAVPSKAAQQQRQQQQQQALSAAQANVVRLQRRQEFLLHVMEGARARVSHLADLRDDQHGPLLSALDTFVGGTTGVNMRRRQEPLMYFGPRMLWRDYTLKKYKMDAKAAAKPAPEDAAGAGAHPNKRGPFAKLQFWRAKPTAAEREPVGRASSKDAPGAAAAAAARSGGDAAAPSHVVQMEQAAARMYPAPAPQQAMERGAPVAGSRSSTQPAKRVTHAPEPVAEGLEAPGSGTGAGVQAVTSAPGLKQELSVPKFLALDDMMKDLGELVSGTGRLGSATPQLQKLQDSAPLTFLERPSARYSSSILTRADVSTWQTSKDTPDFTFALVPPSDTSQGGARGPRIGQLLRRRRGPGGSRQAAPDPELELDNQHKWDDLPWGDINHTGEPHLQAVQIHRYAVLVTDVPVPPFPASAGMGEDVQEQARERSDIPAWLDSSSWISGQAAQYTHANQLLRWLYEKVAMVLFPSFGSPVELMHELTLAGPSEEEGLVQDTREVHGLWDNSLEPGAAEDNHEGLQAASHDEPQNGSVPEDAQPTAVGEVEIVASAARGGGAAAAAPAGAGSAAGVSQAGVGVPPNVPAAAQATGLGPGAVGRAGGDSHVIHVRPPAKSPSLQRGPSARRPSASSHASAPDSGHVLQVGASKLLKLPSMRRPAHTATSSHPTATAMDVPAAVPPAATTSLSGIQEGDAQASLRPRDAQPSTIPSAPHPSDLTAPAAPGVGIPASSPAEAGGNPASGPKGAMGVTRERVQQLWAVAREGVLSGRVAALPRSTRYDPVSALFSELFPHEFDRAIPIMDYSKLHIMLRFWNKHMIGLDSALEVLEQQQRRPWHLPCPAGCLRLHPVDTIDYLTELVGRCQRDIMAERMRVTSGQGRGTGCYVVLFKSQASAALAASNATALTRNTGQFMVHPAPCPSNVNWHTLLIPWATRRWMTFAMLLPKIIVVLFPVAAFSSAFMQLDYIFCPVNATTPEAEAKVQLTWPWYCEQETWFSQIFKKFIVGWCPSLLLSLYSSMVVPNAFHGLVQASFNHLSLSDADREVCLLYVLYDAFNVLLCGVLGATFVQQMNRAIFTEGLHAFFTLLGTQLPQSSNFFINYLSHKALVSFCNKLIIPHGGVTMFLFKRYLRVFRVFSIREQMFKLYTCRSPRYGPEIGNLMLAFVVGSAFAIVSPLVPLMAVVFFLLGYFVWKYLLLYIFVRKYETGGSFFHFIFECLLGCLAIMVIFTGAVIAAKGGVTQFWIIMITLPWLILYAGWYARYTFGPMLGGKLPLEVAAQAPRAHVDPRLFTHPALHPHALGWHPDLHLVWGGLCIWGAQ